MSHALVPSDSLAGVNTAASSIPLTSQPVQIENQKQSKLKTILIVGLAATLLIGLAFVEFKYGLISAGAKLLLTNPLVLSILGGIAACLIIYQIYCYVMSPSQKSSTENENTTTVSWASRVVYTAATEAEYQDALRHNPELLTYFRGEFPNQEHTVSTHVAAKVIIGSRFSLLHQASTNAVNAIERVSTRLVEGPEVWAGIRTAQAALDKYRILGERNSLAIRFLLAPGVVGGE